MTNTEIIRRLAGRHFGHPWRRVRVVTIAPREGACHGYACDCARCCPGWTVVAMLPSGDVAQVFVSHRTRKGALDAGAQWVRAVVGKGWATS